MKHISILVPKGNAVMSTIEGPFMLFSRINGFLAEQGKAPLFAIQFVGETLAAQTYYGRFTFQPDVQLADLNATDLIIIPAVNGDMQQVIQDNAGFFPWVVQRYAAGAEVASLCMGAFLLAATGLLSGKKCSTHWQSHHEFRQMFPDVTLVSDKVITDEVGVYSSGGANSFWNLLLYLLEKFTDREMAIRAAKFFAIEIDRTSQSAFMMFNGQKQHEDPQVIKVQHYIETNYQAKITVDELAEQVALGRRNLERRFLKATSNTIVEYIQRVKIEAAKQSLEQGRANVHEVMYNVGYTDTKAFRTTFKRITGLSPIQYRLKYNSAGVG